MIPRIIKGYENKTEEQDQWPIDYFEDVSVSNKIPGLKAYLSEQYYKIYHFFRDNFHDLNPGEIKVYLSDKKPKLDTYEKDIEEVKREIIQVTEKYSGKSKIELHKIINKIINCKIYSFPVLGEFISKTEDNRDYIVIYYKEHSGKSEEMYKSNIANTLAHEMFHAAHFRFAHRTFNDDSIFAKRVKESLADFFAIMYSLSKNNIFDCKVAINRYKGWIKNFIIRWPYSYALYYYCFEDLFIPGPYYLNRSLEKFKNVLCTSENSMCKAYELLVNIDEITFMEKINEEIQKDENDNLEENIQIDKKIPIVDNRNIQKESNNQIIKLSYWNDNVSWRTSSATKIIIDRNENKIIKETWERNDSISGWSIFKEKKESKEKKVDAKEIDKIFNDLMKVQWGNIYSKDFAFDDGRWYVELMYANTEIVVRQSGSINKPKNFDIVEKEILDLAKLL